MANFLQNIPIIGGMLGGAPKYQSTPLDQNTQNLISQGVNRVTSQTPQDISNQTMSGVNEAGSRINQGNINQEAARTGTNPNMLQAIRNQYSNQTQRSISQLKNQSDIQSQFTKGQQMSDFAKTALAQQQVQTQGFQALSQAYQMNEQARAQMISSLIDLGTNAMVMGKAMSSGRGAKVSASPTDTSSISYQMPDSGFANT